MREEKVSNKGGHAKQRAQHAPQGEESRDIGRLEKEIEEDARANGEEDHADVDADRGCTRNQVRERAQLARIKRGGVIRLEEDLKIGETEHDRHSTDRALGQPEE